jgi:hypothetical protein
VPCDSTAQHRNTKRLTCAGKMRQRNFATSPTGKLVFPLNTGYITGYIDQGFSKMSNPAQKRAIKNYRRRLQKRGVARFEVLGLEADRELIRSLAKKLAQDDTEAKRIRSEVTRAVSGSPQKGGILAALRRSPLVGSDLKLERPFDAGRNVDL